METCSDGKKYISFHFICYEKLYRFQQSIVHNKFRLQRNGKYRMHSFFMAMKIRSHSFKNITKHIFSPHNWNILFFVNEKRSATVKEYYFTHVDL